MLRVSPSGCYLQLVDHLIKQLPSFWTAGVLKVVLYTDLNHDGLKAAANTCTITKNMLLLLKQIKQEDL